MSVQRDQPAKPLEAWHLHQMCLQQTLTLELKGDEAPSDKYRTI